MDSEITLVLDGLSRCEELSIRLKDTSFPLPFMWVVKLNKNWNF